MITLAVGKKLTVLTDMQGCEDVCKLSLMLEDTIETEKER